MKVNPADFEQLVLRAMQSREVAGMRPVIEKELLHYDLLFCLDQAGLLNDIVFQGGTSLRLCHGANRFSEDLDFAGGVDFTSDKLSTMKSCIEEYIGKRYSLEVTVKEPSVLKEDPRYAELKVDKWQIAIVTAPERKDVPKQRIKIEVANIPTYTRVALPLKNNYDFLPDGYDDTLIYTETLNEIMADKLVSLPATQRYVRHRDIWDLVWLQQQGAKLEPELVKSKIADYKLNDFKQMLELRIDSIAEITESKAFHDEMKRFLPTDVFDRTLGQDKFKDYLRSSLTNLLEATHAAIYGEHIPEPIFKL